MMARPPARLATISSSCCSCAKTSNGTTHSMPRRIAIRHRNSDSIDGENIPRCPSTACRDPERNESLAGSFTPHDPSEQQDPQGSHYHTQEAQLELRNHQHTRS